MIIRNLAEITQLRQQIESLKPRLKTDAADIKRYWQDFGRWAPAMDRVCKHNNQVFSRLPDTITLSVGVAYQLAHHMTSVGNSTDQLMDFLHKQHSHLFELDKHYENALKAKARLPGEIQKLEQALEAAKGRDALSLMLTTALFMAHPSLISVGIGLARVMSMASDDRYAAYYAAINSHVEALRRARTMIAEIPGKKKELVKAIPKTDEKLREVSDKLDLVLRTYGLVEGSRGEFVLKRGSWVALPWEVSFGEKIRHRTPGNTYELCVLDVGISPRIATSRHFDPIPDRPSFNLSFLHRRMTLHLCKLKNKRAVHTAARQVEMDAFARGSIGRVGITSTGRIVGGLFRAKRVQFSHS